MDGVLVIDKPAGVTSHDVVARMRRVLRERRIGHTGTLDPAATGVLPLVVGRATRLARFLSASDKSYEAVVRLGVRTDTCDTEGQRVGAEHTGPWPSRDAIEAALDTFRGTSLQQPPAFSAKKIGGKRSYEIARDAQRKSPSALTLPTPASPPPVEVTVHAIELVTSDGPALTLCVVCGAGFYVRSLARDLGERLGTGAHLAALTRTRAGEYALADAVPLAEAERDGQEAARRLIPLSRLLPGLRPVTLTADGVRHAVHGRDLGAADCTPEKGVGSLFRALPGPGETTPDPFFVRLLDPAGELVGIAEPATTPGLLHPSVVLV